MLANCCGTQRPNGGREYSNRSGPSERSRSIGVHSRELENILKKENAARRVTRYRYDPVSHVQPQCHHASPMVEAAPASNNPQTRRASEKSCEFLMVENPDSAEVTPVDCDPQAPRLNEKLCMSPMVQNPHLAEMDSVSHDLHVLTSVETSSETQQTLITERKAHVDEHSCPLPWGEYVAPAVQMQKLKLVRKASSDSTQSGASVAFQSMAEIDTAVPKTFPVAESQEPEDMQILQQDFHQRVSPENLTRKLRQAKVLSQFSSRSSSDSEGDLQESRSTVEPMSDKSSDDMSYGDQGGSRKQSFFDIGKDDSDDETGFDKKYNAGRYSLDGSEMYIGRDYDEISDLCQMYDVHIKALNEASLPPTPSQSPRS